MKSGASMMDAPLFCMNGVSADEPLTTRFLSPPSYDYVMTARTFGNAQASLALHSLILPVLLRLADVSLVAELSHLLCLSEELLCLVRISLLN